MADSLPIISIIVPVYNVAEYLPQCLDSLVNQTYPNIEIICVNDGSTDNSAEVLNNYGAKYRSITIFCQDNNGVSSARNLGLKKAMGDYVMFVDSDDWIDITACSEMVIAASANNADIVMCTYVKEFENSSIPVHIFDHAFYADEKKVHEIHRRLFGPVREETSSPANLDVLIQPWAQMFRKTLLEGIEFHDINEIGSFEDGLFQIAVYERAKSFYYIDKHYYHYRKTNENSIITRYKQKLAEQYENIYLLLDKRIENCNYPDDYRVALNNRIVFSLIGLILNESNAQETVSVKAKHVKQIVSKRIYEKAFERVDWSYLPFKWRVFFKLLEKKETLFISVLLNIRSMIMIKK